MACRILIFAKAPIAGQVKTRLAPLLGFDGAAAFAREMLIETIAEARAVAGASVQLCTSPEPEHPSWTGVLPDEVGATAQVPGDLGVRLAHATRHAVDDGHWPVLIGADCPALDRTRLRAACGELESSDAFIHPTQDGGYALLALRRFSPLLFSRIAWSGPQVAVQTVARLQALDWRHSIGQVLRDIDEPADYEAYLRAGRRSRARDQG